MVSLFVIFVVFPYCFASQVIGKFGATYHIKEKDAYDEILERAKNVDQEAIRKKLVMGLTNQFKVNISLKKAEKDNIRYQSLSYTLPYDIKDHKGNVIYPSGFTFNPLDYARIPFLLVFFDGTSGREIKWLKESGMLSRNDVILIATRGNIYDLSSILNRTVYAASDYIVRTLGIQKVPCYIYQEGNKLVIREVGVYGKN